jgi:hypothetical protein
VHQYLVLPLVSHYGSNMQVLLVVVSITYYG